MFEMFFGMIWTTFMVFFTIIFYGSNNGVITVNGQQVSQEEFSNMIWPKIFIGIFWLIGLFMLFQGLRKIIRNYLTNVNGEICYGKICNIYNSGAYINGMPEMKADVFVYIPSTQETKIISEVIGFNNIKYLTGDYLELKYYNGDINFERIIDSSDIPLAAQNELMKVETNDNIDDNRVIIKADSIFVNGVEYVRKDSIKSDKI